MPPGSVHSAEDVAQEVTARTGRTWRDALRRPMQGVLYASWLRGVGRRVLAEVRAAHDERQLEAPEQVIGKFPAPDVLVAQAEALQVLAGAYDDLPGDSLVVLRLRQMGLRWQEIASLVRGWEPGVSVRTLQRRHRQAEQPLRARLQRAIFRPHR